MDIYCQRCDEPYDVYHVCYDMDKEKDDYSEKGTKPSDRLKNGEGCPACEWGKTAPKQQSMRGMAMGAMADVMGDDVDGMASMMDDFEFAGMLEDE